MKNHKFMSAILCLWLCLGTFVFASSLEARDLFLNQEICWEIEKDGMLHSTLRLTVTRTGKGRFFLKAENPNHTDWIPIGHRRYYF